MKLLDTTFLIHYWGGKGPVRKYLEANEEEEFITTTINLKEIAVGRALQGKLDRAELESAFGWVEVVPIGMGAAINAAELEAELQRDTAVNGDRTNALAGDLLIAAVARDKNATVVTRNVSDFEQFDGVSVEQY